MSLLNDTKHWMRDLFRYPVYRVSDASYDEYWSSRDTGVLNSYQKARADFLLKQFHNGESVLDIGCGDGRILSYLKQHNESLRLSGIDSSPEALKIASERGLSVRRGDVRDISTLAIENADHVILLEVLEHLPESETLLEWAAAHASKSVVFSVPNTGFIVHRLRLLFGRFPLQWRAHPAEHLRFWTVRDMHFWLHSLGYRYQLHTYEGVPVLNRIWPSLFAAGIIVSLPRQHETR